MPTILVAADDDRVRRVARAYLERDGLAVAEAADGPAALAQIQSGGVDLLVLDLALPLPGGWTVLRGLSDIPVLVLTAGGEESERLAGPELDADDYIVKPFSPRELAARAGALLRRARAHPGRAPAALAAGGLRLLPGTRSVCAGQRQVELRPREYELLEFLVRHPGQVFSRRQLLDRVWGPGFTGDPRTVDTHIRQLRDKLGPAAEPIRTAWGSGYKLELR